MEVHYELRHYFIASESYDSFNATVEQILVLQPGVPPPDTPYKRKNVRDGPIRLNPTPAQQQQFQHSTPGASGSHTLAITETSTSDNDVGALVLQRQPTQPSQHSTAGASGSRTSTSDDNIVPPVQWQRYPASDASSSRTLASPERSTSDNDNGTKDGDDSDSNNTGGMYCLFVTAGVLSFC